VGVLLDSSVTIAAERARQNFDELAIAIDQKIGNTNIVLSAVGYTELLHGLHREVNPQRRRRREQFFADLLSVAPVKSYTSEMAAIAGRIAGEQSLIGNNIPFVDLMIGATALSLGYSVLTANLRHFRLIPGLEVIPF